ncbi:MAG: EI24 domain-containing protein [Oligoflexus sp.]
MNPMQRLTRGLKAYWQGVSWLRRHPSYMALLFVPWVLGLFFMMGSFTLFIRYDEAILSWLLFQPGEAWWQLGLYYAAWGVAYVSAMILVLLGGLLFANILAAPIYDVVSVAIERDMRHGQVDEISLWASLRLIPEELKKVIVILAISLFLLLIPGLNLLALFVTAFLIGWDFYDYPLARRGWSFRQRWNFVRGDIWAVMGLGLWLTIPFVQFLLMPLAVAGGTLLNLERLERIAEKESAESTSILLQKKR